MKVRIKQHFGQQEPLWLEGEFFDKYLLALAAVFVVVGGILLISGGLHTAFYPVHNVAQAILPDFMWAHITFVGDTVVALVIALILSYRFPHLTVAILIAAVGGTLLIHGLKAGFSTARPPAILDRETFTVIGPAFKTNSMPSGHTATAFILVGLLTRCAQSVWAKVLILVGGIFIGWSRVACGVHWPADVCMGAALGLVSAWVGLRLSRFVSLNLILYGIVSALLVTSAVLLFEEHGGFDSTYYTAKLFGFIALAYWFYAWIRTLKPGAQ